MSVFVGVSIIIKFIEPGKLNPPLFNPNNNWDKICVVFQSHTATTTRSSVPAMSFSHFATKLWMLCKLAKSNLRGETYMSQIGFMSPRVGTNQKMANKHPNSTKKKPIEKIPQTRKERQNCTYLSKSFLECFLLFGLKKTLGIQLQTSQLHPRLYCRQDEEPKPAPSVSPSSEKKEKNILFQALLLVWQSQNNDENQRLVMHGTALKIWEKKKRWDKMPSQAHKKQKKTTPGNI